jgi:hypothetical protein
VDYIPTNGTLTFTPGVTSLNFNVPIIDDLQVENDETLGLALTNPSGANSLGSAAATLTIVNSHFAPGQLQFSSSGYTNLVSDPNAVITVVRSNGYTGVVSVRYSTSDGSAVAGTDYVATNGSLAFDDGETVKTFLVPLINHVLPSSFASVNLALSNPTGGATLGTPANATLSILANNQGLQRSIQFGATNYAVLESATNAVITLLRFGALTGAVSVTFNTSDGTATAGLNYLSVSSVIAFADGEPSKTVLVPIIDDSIKEPNQTVLLTLSNPTGGVVIGTTNATITIIDVDSGPGGADRTFQPGAGANNFVRSVALQADGKVVVGGAFTLFDGANRNFITRLNTNGVQDSGFNPGSGANALVASVASTADGRVVLGGAFTSVGGTAFNRVGRLRTNGAPDLNFNLTAGFDAAVDVVTILANGSTLVGGAFKQPTPGITELQSDGGVAVRL